MHVGNVTHRTKVHGLILSLHYCYFCNRHRHRGALWALEKSVGRRNYERKTILDRKFSFGKPIVE